MNLDTEFKSDRFTKLWEKDNDKLSTRFFAEQLGKAILNYKGNDSLVMGLCGEWGSGKTSIIKSTLNYIEKSQEVPYETIFEMLINPFNRIFRKDKAYDYIDDDYIIIEFNPWNFSNQDQLISQFFQEMIVKLKKTDYSGLKKTAQKLELYASFFESMSMIFPPTIPVTKAIKNSVVSIKDFSNNKLNDLDEIKEELNDTLENQNRKIIIFIDDIDRLNKIEIHQIFQLVKSLADFKNTIYILAFDKEIVVNSLKNVQSDTNTDLSANLSENHGLKYLEKIVQVIFEVPKISRIEINLLLDEQLKKLTKYEEFDKDQWAHYYINGIRYLFKNIRDINRYFNTLIFSFDLLKDEVNLADLFVITALQVFIPDIYNDIKNNKEIFTGDHNDIDPYEIQQNKKNLQTFCDNVISKGTAKIPKEKLKVLLMSLFPQVKYIYDVKNPYNFSKSHNRKRIYNLDMFDTYFKFYVPKWEFSQREFDYLIETANNKELFTDELLELIEDKKIYKFFELLTYYKLDIPKRNIQVIIESIMDTSDFSINYPRQKLDQINMALIYLFGHLNQKERFIAFKNAINNLSRSLYIPIKFFEKYDHNVKIEFYDKSKYEQFITISQADSLKQDFAKRISIWAENGKIIENRIPLSILQIGALWGEEDKIKTFMNNISENDLITLIYPYLYKRSSFEEGAKEFIENIRNIINLRTLRTKLEKVVISRTDKNEEYFIKLIIKEIDILNSPNSFIE